MKWHQQLSQNIIALSVASLLNSISSEMLSVLLPIYMSSALKFSSTTIGLTEGFAVALAVVIKLVAGALVDKFQTYLLFTGLGYFFAAISRVVLLVIPKLLATALPWSVVLFSKALEKIGKGLRSSPRDALLSASIHPNFRGISFALHHLAQILGCVISLLLALALVTLYGTASSHSTDDYMWEMILLFSMPFGFLSVFVIAYFGQTRDVALQQLIEVDRLIQQEEEERAIKPQPYHYNHSHKLVGSSDVSSNTHNPKLDGLNENHYAIFNPLKTISSHMQTEPIEDNLNTPRFQPPYIGDELESNKCDDSPPSFTYHLVSPQNTSQYSAGTASLPPTPIKSRSRYHPSSSCNTPLITPGQTCDSTLTGSIAGAPQVQYGSILDHTSNHIMSPLQQSCSSCSTNFPSPHPTFGPGLNLRAMMNLFTSQTNERNDDQQQDKSHHRLQNKAADNFIKLFIGHFLPPQGNKDQDFGFSNHDADESNSGHNSTLDTIYDEPVPSESQIPALPLHQYPPHKIQNAMELKCNCLHLQSIISEVLEQCQDDSLYGNLIVTDQESSQPPKDDEDTRSNDNLFPGNVPGLRETTPLLRHHHDFDFSNHMKRDKKQIQGLSPFQKLKWYIKYYFTKFTRAVIKGVRHSYFPTVYSLHNRDERRKQRHWIRTKKRVYYSLVDCRHDVDCMYTCHQHWLVDQHPELIPALQQLPNQSNASSVPRERPTGSSSATLGDFEPTSSISETTKPIAGPSDLSGLNSDIFDDTGSISPNTRQNIRKSDLLGQSHALSQPLSSNMDSTSRFSQLPGPATYSEILRTMKQKEHDKYSSTRTRLILTLICIIAFGQIFSIPHTFLILLAHNQQLSIQFIVFVVLLYNLVYSLFTTPAGMLSDRLRRHGSGGGAFTVMVGWVLRACILLFLAYNCRIDPTPSPNHLDNDEDNALLKLTTTTTTIIVGFVFLGFYMAFTEGTIKALVVDVMPAQFRKQLKKKKNGKELLILLKKKKFQEQRERLQSGVSDPLLHQSDHEHGGNDDDNYHHHHHGHNHHDSSFVGIAFGAYDSMMGVSEFVSALVAGLFFDKQAIVLWLCFNSFGSVLSAIILFYWHHRVTCDPYSARIFNQHSPAHDKNHIQNRNGESDITGAINGIFFDLTAPSAPSSHRKRKHAIWNSPQEIVPNIITSSDKSTLVDVCILIKEFGPSSDFSFHSNSPPVFDHLNKNSPVQQNPIPTIHALAVVRALNIPTSILAKQLGRQPLREDLSALSLAAYNLANVFNQSYSAISPAMDHYGHTDPQLEAHFQEMILCNIPANVLDSPAILCYENQQQPQPQPPLSIFFDDDDDDDENFHPTYSVLLIAADERTMQRRQIRRKYK
jgi:nitrate/nitrite transporter NarK